MINRRKGKKIEKVREGEEKRREEKEGRRQV
jgi:hypothetical protein